jgi:hypothetical protein
VFTISCQLRLFGRIGPQHAAINAVAPKDADVETAQHVGSGIEGSARQGRKIGLARELISSIMMVNGPPPVNRSALAHG